MEHVSRIAHYRSHARTALANLRGRGTNFEGGARYWDGVCVRDLVRVLCAMCTWCLHDFKNIYTAYFDVRL